jgi:hypothetical protein
VRTSIKPTIQTCINNGILLAVYACFFCVQLSFSIDAINSSRGYFYIGHTTGKSLAATAVTIIKQDDKDGSKRLNIRLSKRFNASYAPAIISNFITVSAPYCCRTIQYRKYNSVTRSSVIHVHSFRGPPAAAQV